MTNKIVDIEERISRSLQESLDELYLLRQEEAGHLEGVKEQSRALVKELRQLSTAITKAIKDYDQSREELMESSRRGEIPEEKASYERASEFMKIRGSLEERYRLLSAKKEELSKEERRLERLVNKSEKMGNRLRMVLNLLTVPEEVVQNAEELRSTETLSAAFQLAERESITFARELHDGPTQTFSAIGLMLEMGKEYLVRKEYSTALEEIERALEHTRTGLDEVRSLLFSLSPTGIQDGFELPLRRLKSQMKQMWNCDFSFTMSGAVDEIPGNIRVGTFKTLHQAVINAARHGAREVKATIAYSKKVLKVRITDNGKGFDVEKAKKDARERGSYGLINMEERVSMLGGNFDVHSMLNKGGSRVSFSIPILDF